MSYASVGSGETGQALAHAFARKNINVTVASRRSPEELAPQAREIGHPVVAKSLQYGLEADTIIPPVSFREHREIAKALPSWNGKTIIGASYSLPAMKVLSSPVSISPWMEAWRRSSAES